MKTVLLTTIAMLAFAANSLLARAGLSGTDIGAGDFTLVRVASGALALGLILWMKEGTRPKGSWAGAVSLFAYMAGFSFAYLSLPTGTGALILFGGVQLTMFAGSSLMGATPPWYRWLGAMIGLGGLVVLFLPSAGRPDAMGAALMGIAAVGWGIYSILGKGVRNPLAATAGNFLWCSPLALLLWVATQDRMPLDGFALAVASGVMASGMGYAIWYAVLPSLKGAQAASAQLSVPVLAALAGWLVLSEPLSPDFLLALVLVIAGMALAILPMPKRG